MMDAAGLKSESMQWDFTVNFEGDHVFVASNDQHSIAYARALWAGIVEACKAHDCYLVLAISRTPEPLPILDGYEHAELFRELGIDSRYRIAWAELGYDARKALSFVEDVLVNRGLPGRLFGSEEDAREWLFHSGT